MVVTMVSMRVMKNPVHKIVDMIAVRNRLVTAARPVDMVGAL